MLNEEKEKNIEEKQTRAMKRAIASLLLIQLMGGYKNDDDE